MRTTKLFSILIASLALTAPLALSDCGSKQIKAQGPTIDWTPQSMPAGASWDGVYFNPVWGYLHIVTQGSTFKGRWKRADESAWGEMKGSVEQDIAKFDWVEHKLGMVGPTANTKGKGHYKYDRPKGENVDDRLLGEWGFEDAESGGGEWDCVKQRNMKPNLASIKGEAESTVGTMK